MWQPQANTLVFKSASHSVARSYTTSVYYIHDGCPRRGRQRTAGWTTPKRGRPCPELLTMASRRRDRKRNSAESSFIWQPLESSFPGEKVSTWLTTNAHSEGGRERGDRDIEREWERESDREREKERERERQREREREWERERERERDRERETERERERLIIIIMPPDARKRGVQRKRENHFTHGGRGRGKDFYNIVQHAVP